MRMVPFWSGWHQRQRRRGRVAGLWVCLWFLSIVHCSHFFPMAPVPMDATPELILEAMAKNMEKLRDLEGKVKIRVDASGFRETAVAKVLFRKPHLLKIEVKGPLGVTLANVQMKRDTVRVYYPLSNFLIQGKPSPGNFELMTGIRLDVADFQHIFIGDGGLTREALNHLVEFGVDGKEYLLSFQWEGEKLKCWIDPRLLLVTKSELYDQQGVLKFRHRYAFYEKFEDLRLPTKIEIEREREDQYVQLMLKEGKVNGSIAEDRFRLNVPVEVERIELGN